MDEASRFYEGAQAVLPRLKDILLSDSTMVLLLPQDISLKSTRSITKEFVRAHVLRGATEVDRVGGGSSRAKHSEISSRRNSSFLGNDFDPFLEVRHMITLCGKAVQIHERRDPITGHVTRTLHVFATQSRRAQFGGGPFRETRSVIVIDEEVCYEDDNRSFTALILERPLMGVGDVPRINSGEPLFSTERLAIEWVNLLHNIARSDSLTNSVVERALKLAKKVPMAIAQANNVLQDISEAAEDLHDASWKLAEKLASGRVFGLAKESTRLIEMLAEAVNAMIMTLSYSDTFNTYFVAMAKPERVLMNALFEMRETSWKPSDISQELIEVPLSQTIDCIQRLNDARSPLEKIQCVFAASKCIMKDVNTYFQGIKDGDHIDIKLHAHSKSALKKDGLHRVNNNVQHRRRPTPIPTMLSESVKQAKVSVLPSIAENHTKTVVIAADEMLPLLIKAICHAAPAALLANTLYMRELSSEGLRESKLGYALAMWEAAISFIGQDVWSSLELGDRDFGVQVKRATSGSTLFPGEHNSANTVLQASLENESCAPVSVEVDDAGSHVDELSRPRALGVDQDTRSPVVAQMHLVKDNPRSNDLARDHLRFVHAVARAKLNSGKITQEEYARIVTQHAAPSPYEFGEASNESVSFRPGNSTPPLLAISSPDVEKSGGPSLHSSNVAKEEGEKLDSSLSSKLHPKYQSSVEVFTGVESAGKSEQEQTNNLDLKQNRLSTSTKGQYQARARESAAEPIVDPLAGLTFEVRAPRRRSSTLPTQ